MSPVRKKNSKFLLFWTVSQDDSLFSWIDANALSSPTTWMFHLLLASLRGTCMSTSDRSAATSSGSVSPNSLACTTTYSTQQVLANALQERMADQPPEEDERLFCSGLSTPNNSPGSTPPDSPTPSSYGPIDLLQRGAKIIRRKWTGVETPRRRSRRSVPRIPKHEIQVPDAKNPLEKKSIFFHLQ